MSDAIELRAGPASARIARRGAEWLSWRVGDRDLLWRPDPAVWADTAPVLFPVVGWTRHGAVRVDGRSYGLGLHGFARHETFDILARGGDYVSLRIRDTDATRAAYPFGFTFDITYRLTAEALDVTLEVTNTDARTIPYACGLHPGFAWPFAGGDASAYRVLFDEAETSEVPVITADGLFSDARRQIPLDGRLLPLGPALFAREALCFLDVRSRGLTFAAPDGEVIRMDLTNFAHVALWSRAAAPFLAIEAWTGHGDPENFDGDLFEKPSIVHLAPGETGKHAVRIAFGTMT